MLSASHDCRVNSAFSNSIRRRSGASADPQTPLDGNFKLGKGDYEKTKKGDKARQLRSGASLHDMLMVRIRQWPLNPTKKFCLVSKLPICVCCFLIPQKCYEHICFLTLASFSGAARETRLLPQLAGVHNPPNIPLILGWIFCDWHHFIQRR